MGEGEDFILDTAKSQTHMHQVFEFGVIGVEAGFIRLWLHRAIP